MTITDYLKIEAVDGRTIHVRKYNRGGFWAFVQSPSKSQVDEYAQFDGKGGQEKAIAWAWEKNQEIIRKGMSQELLPIDEDLVAFMERWPKGGR